MRVSARPSLALPGPDWAYFFDIDGTLAEFAATPVEVRVDPALRQRIEALLIASRGAVALISGRSIADIDALFPRGQIPVAGQHGAERRSANGEVVRYTLPAARFDWLRAQCNLRLRQYGGVRVEDKGGSLALHYRAAPRLAGFVHRLARSLAAECDSELTVISGKRVVELLPAGRTKGNAVLEFLNEPPFRGRLPVFVGDDESDETAFEIVNRLGGCSVKVGVGRTSARWRLPSVTAVRRWIERSRAAIPAQRVTARREAS